MNHTNGVKARAWAGGDLWAEQHRQELGTQFVMQDVDAHVLATLLEDDEDRLFFEYVPDAAENIGKVVREFALVALFDRKNNLQATRSSRSTLSTAANLWHLRTHAARQPAHLAPRFFFAVGVCAPYMLAELDIQTGKECSRTLLEDGDWRRAWCELGLDQKRCNLARWLRAGRPGL